MTKVEEAYQKILLDNKRKALTIAWSVVGGLESPHDKN
jgi:hypothetical protein